jgi:hypothetical protein
MLRTEWCCSATMLARQKMWFGKIRSTVTVYTTSIFLWRTKFAFLDYLSTWSNFGFGTDENVAR